MSLLSAIVIMVIPVILIVIFVIVRRKLFPDDGPLVGRLAEHLTLDEKEGIDNSLEKSRLPGETTTDAPPPEGKKKKTGRGK